ncbi:MAG TPA: hypothetical protein VMF60_09375, partial [Acidimicrobiales bacterium]|nr:hypothetical protein [Acidimicrobiales bacterium]
SDRPVTEPQVVRSLPPRARGAVLHTQYLDIADEPAAAMVLSQPVWLWGAEHGVNEHGVAIGNELVNTVDDPRPAAPALIGMDLVRLGLERARSAEEALEVMTGLLERHGQGGVGDQVNDLAYWSSFLVADPGTAWVLETSGRTWAARPVTGGDAISNRLTLRRDWTRASTGVPVGADFDAWRDRATPTGFADGRLAASRAFVGRVRPVVSARHGAEAARAAVAHLRDHGSGPWGAPGDTGPVVGAPAEVSAEGSGVTVCMHVRDFECTTASMVVELPADARVRGRVWVALGNPCASVFVPALAPTQTHAALVPDALADEALARRFAAVSRVAETDASALDSVRAVLGPVEEALWDEAESLGSDPALWKVFAAGVGARLAGSLDALARRGLALPG